MHAARLLVAGAINGVVEAPRPVVLEELTESRARGARTDGAGGASVICGTMDVGKFASN